MFPFQSLAWKEGNLRGMYSHFPPRSQSLFVLRKLRPRMWNLEHQSATFLSCILVKLMSQEEEENRSSLSRPCRMKVVGDVRCAGNRGWLVGAGKPRSRLWETSGQGSVRRRPARQTQTMSPGLDFGTGLGQSVT